MKNIFLVTAAAASLFASAALADPAMSGPNNAPIKSPDTNISSMPVKGANSFTEGEARDHIKAKGYSHISALKKDSNGIWRGMARMKGKRVHVSVDFEGNVNPV